MTKRLAISARQVTAICQGAAKAGFIPEIVIDGVTVRLLPERLVQQYSREELDHDDDIVL